MPEVKGLVTCAGHLLGQLQGLPNTRPCGHGKAWARILQSENLERSCQFVKRDKESGSVEITVFFKAITTLLTFSQLTPRHHRSHCPQSLHERGVYHQVTTGIRQMLNKAEFVLTIRFIETQTVSLSVRLVTSLVTRYLSEETLTRMRSSPTLTFSPSDLCLEAGWMVHQQASPVIEKQI